jgi:phage FluMu gp28-like protein
MSAILPFLKIDSNSLLTRYFTEYQTCWIHAEDPFHEAKKRVFALAEKSVRIGWTFADGFKNVRKRLRFRNRDYLFVTRDWPSALEYMNNVYGFADMLGYTRAVLSHGEDIVKVKSLDSNGSPTSLTEEVKIGYIKFDNGSRIIAFSSNPYAMAVYGGDVGLDEFAKHPNAKLLWETAQGRVTLGHDLAVWSAHDGEDTLFHQFAQQARATLLQSSSSSSSSSSNSSGTAGTPRPAASDSIRIHRPAFRSLGEGRSSSLTVPQVSKPAVSQASEPAELSPVDQPTQSTAVEKTSPLLPSLPSVESAPPVPSTPAFPISVQPRPSAIKNPASSSFENQREAEPRPKFKNDGDTNSPWNLYFRVTMPDALDLGLLEIVKRTRDVDFTPESFIADCRSRSGPEEIFQQSYMCNPVGAASAAIVEYSAIERCRYDYEIKRVHLENDAIKKQFGEFNPNSEQSRTDEITDFIDLQFKPLFQSKSVRDSKTEAKRYRLGFDVAASGQGDLSAIYIDEEIGSDLWLAGLFTARTEDWHFIKTVLFHFLWKLKNLKAAGDESGLGRQICWEAASRWSYKFQKVNFTTKKHDLGFALMNQLSVAEKRFPHSHQDIASDFFALRKMHNGVRWNFSEGKNLMNPASHCDIAWAGALSTFAQMENKNSGVGASLILENGTVIHSHEIPVPSSYEKDPQKAEADRIRLAMLDDSLWSPFH